MSVIRTLPIDSPYAERREYPRYVTPPMYHGVTVRVLSEQLLELEGHAYNLSRGGAQIELDVEIEPGAEVAVSLLLPGDDASEAPGGIFAFGRIVWLTDTDEPGPARMAVAFTEFPRANDIARFHRYLSRAPLKMAA